MMALVVNGMSLAQPTKPLHVLAELTRPGVSRISMKLQ